jgi:hypothetical protein
MEVDDRIFSTSVDLEYTFAPVNILAPSDAEKLEFTVPSTIEKGSLWDTEVLAKARKTTLEIFATDDSASVQVCLNTPSDGKADRRHFWPGYSLQDGSEDHIREPGCPNRDL